LKKINKIRPQMELHEMMEDASVVPAADEDEELIPGVGRQPCPWQRLRLRLPVEEDDDATDEDHEEEDEEDDGGAWPAGEGHSATLVGSRCFIYGGVDDRSSPPPSFFPQTFAVCVCRVRHVCRVC
jgi:hypothetical protein